MSEHSGMSMNEITEVIRQLGVRAAWAARGQHFKYYLHDYSNRHEVKEYLEAQGVHLSEEAWEHIGRAFSEVELTCTVDDQGKVTIWGVN